MKIITSITSEARQRIVLKLDNNEKAIMRLYYYASQNSWYFDIDYNGYINNGNKVVLTMNALRHLKDRLPFGIAFIASSNAEPFALNSFSSGSAMMLLLNQDDVNEIEEVIYDNK